MNFRIYNYQVARLLMAVDSGRLHEFKGQSMDSIDVNGKSSFNILFSHHLSILYRDYWLCLASNYGVMYTLILVLLSQNRLAV